jgi:hypothetical protein
MILQFLFNHTSRNEECVISSNLTSFTSTDAPDELVYLVLCVVAAWSALVDTEPD